jgi:hypothetical protein
VWLVESFYNVQYEIMFLFVELWMMLSIAKLPVCLVLQGSFAVILVVQG